MSSQRFKDIRTVMYNTFATRHLLYLPAKWGTPASQPEQSIVNNSLR